jgi:hypothetical protein
MRAGSITNERSAPLKMDSGSDRFQLESFGLCNAARVERLFALRGAPLHRLQPRGKHDV